MSPDVGLSLSIVFLPLILLSFLYVLKFLQIEFDAGFGLMS